MLIFAVKVYLPPETVVHLSWKLAAVPRPSGGSKPGMCMLLPFQSRGGIVSVLLTERRLMLGPMKACLTLLP